MIAVIARPKAEAICLDCFGDKPLAMTPDAPRNDCRIVIARPKAEAIYVK
jgi:hypothetical protein